MSETTSVSLTTSSTPSPNGTTLHFEQSIAQYQPKHFYDFGKRLLESVVALLILIGFSPLWLIVALGIKLTSPGPILFKGRVVGRYGREFTYYKFRSMTYNNDNSQHKAFIENYVRQHLAVKSEAPQIAVFDDNHTVKLQTVKVNESADSGEIQAFDDNHTVKLHLEKFDNTSLHFQKVQSPIHDAPKLNPPQFKLTNDKRVTGIGRIIRKFSIDEVPQLYNVLRGEMAIVGPRPPVPYEFALYDETCKKRLLVRPGISGLAQVKARGRATFQQMLSYDFEYIEKRSLVFDVQIMLETPLAMLKGA